MVIEMIAMMNRLEYNFFIERVLKVTPRIYIENWWKGFFYQERIWHTSGFNRPSYQDRYKTAHPQLKCYLTC